MTRHARVVPHETVRLEVPVDLGFEEFRSRYEQAVPPFDLERYTALAREGTSWADVQRITDDDAPHGFLIYWRTEIDLVMRLAGHTGHCTSYLIGNHTIAERMYRHDPAATLYAPLRTQIHEDHDHAVWFTVDQPSSHFASFTHPDIHPVGLELDHKLRELLAFLGVPAAPLLRA